MKTINWKLLANIAAWVVSIGAGGYALWQGITAKGPDLTVVERALVVPQDDGSIGPQIIQAIILVEDRKGERRGYAVDMDLWLSLAVGDGVDRSELE